MSGLKVQLSLTIVSLLAFGMLLINVVTMTLWQQDAVRREAEKIKLLLEVSTQDIDQKEPDSGLGVEEIVQTLDGHDITCYKIRLAGEDITSPEGCKSELVLSTLSDETEMSGASITSLNGTTFGVFTIGRRFLRAAEPVFLKGVQIGTVVVEKDLRPLYAELRQRERMVFVYILLNTIILSIIGFFRLVSLIIRPLDRLVEVADTYSQNASFMLLNEKPGSEFGRLSASLNGMLSQIEADNAKLRLTVNSLEKANLEATQTRNKMILTEKLASMGRLSAGLAHEIGNPLAIVQGYIELIGQQSTTSDERTQFASRAGKEVARIDTLIKQLLDVSRKSNAPMKSVHVHEVLNELVAFISDQRKNSHIEFISLFGAVDDVVIGENDGLKQIFLNCLLNSIDAIGEEASQPGCIQISTTTKTVENAEAYLQITITDNGSGIDEADLDNVFDPFFTRKEPGKGTGLGLAVSHTLVENFGGTIYIDRGKEVGTHVVIELPLENKKISESSLDEESL